ncbi:MAG: cytochrome c [Chromatiaceae bacterium]
MTPTRKLLFAAAAFGLSMGLVATAYAADGAALYKEKVCNTCHGDDGNTPILPVYPKLSGQNAPYLLEQMKDIRDGKRTNGLSAAMKAVVGSVTDDQFQAIADWLATL